MINENLITKIKKHPKLVALVTAGALSISGTAYAQTSVSAKNDGRTSVTIEQLSDEEKNEARMNGIVDGNLSAIAIQETFKDKYKLDEEKFILAIGGSKYEEISTDTSSYDDLYLSNYQKAYNKTIDKAISSTVKNGMDYSVEETKILTDGTFKVNYVKPEYELTDSKEKIITNEEDKKNINVSEDEINKLIALVYGEGGNSYESALAIISTIMNRLESEDWKNLGKTPLEQAMAHGQFNAWDSELTKKCLENPDIVPEYVRRAVIDGLNGKRNHSYTTYRPNSGAEREQIGEDGYHYFKTK